MRKKYHIKGDKLIIESDPTVEIPLVKMMYVRLEHDNAGPLIKITTVSGVVMKFWIDPNQTDKILNFIRDKFAEALMKELKKK